MEKLQDQYTEMMNRALREEAERLKLIMDKIATKSLEEEKLEGQRKLDDSLKKVELHSNFYVILIISFSIVMGRREGSAAIFYSIQLN